MKKYLVPFLCFMVILSVCTVSQAQEKTKISAIKSMELTSEKRAALIGKTVTVEGYYVDDPVPMLVESMELYFVDMPIPEDRYIVLTGKGVEDLSRKRFFGAYVKLTGRVEVSKRPEVRENIKMLGEAFALELVCDTQPILITPLDKSWITTLPSISKIDTRIKEGFPPSPPKRDRFAILLSGGANPNAAYIRYWNNLKFMYATLLKNGFSPKEIIVVYKNGQGEDTDMPVDYPANTQGVEKAFGYVKDHIAQDGLFFYYSTNHGGGLLIPCYEGWYSSPYNWERYDNFGRIDSNNDEREPDYNELTIDRDLNSDGDMADVLKVDEITFLYNDANNLLDDRLAILISPIVCKKMIIVMVQCFSGGNIYDLRWRPSKFSKSNNRIIVSSSGETEPAWSNADYGIFSYYFTSALNGATPNGTAVNADRNGDKKVSILEAFIYAQENDKSSETPQYDDTGDGVSHTVGDGSLGANTFLQ